MENKTKNESKLVDALISGSKAFWARMKLGIEAGTSTRYWWGTPSQQEDIDDPEDEDHIQDAESGSTYGT